jgi:hypothetical protein
MVHDLDLPMFLWAEACCTTVYILNRCPHKVLKDKTPKEAFTREKPDVSHFKVFGSPVYIHVPEEKRMKLEPSNLKGILVGYSESSKAYKIYVPSQEEDSSKPRCEG